MKNILAFTTLILSTCSSVVSAQEQAVAVTPAQEQATPAAGTQPASEGLSDLGAMTFSCPKAGLNAAAREAAKVPSQGHYQFAYFKIIDDSHHSLYEVHFKSNYHAEADLKYCVSVYCQQGQDQAPSVSLIGKEPVPTAAGAAHRADCGESPTPAQGVEPKKRLKKR